MSPRRPSAPQRVGPNTTDPFPYKDYVRVREQLTGALKGPQRFYALLCGASGMGKTSVQRELRVHLDRQRHQMIYLSSSMVSAVGIVRSLAIQLHITPRRSYLENVRLLGEVIAAIAGHLLLWVDEADQVNTQTLQEIRMLAESDANSQQLFSIVLSGLPELRRKLDALELFPLKRRINWRWYLVGLQSNELEPFIRFRFGDQSVERIPVDIHKELFERTKATPALVESVIRHALERSCTDNSVIDPEVFRDILDTLGY